MNPRIIPKSLPAVALALLFGTAPSQATQTVRELFDGLNAGHDQSAIDGLTNVDVTTIGLQGSWQTFPQGYDSTGTNWVSCTNIIYRDAWSVSWPLANLQYGYGGEILSDTGTGANGMLNVNTGGLNLITDTNTGLPFGQYTSQAYATRPLKPSACIDFQSNSTNYFSVRISKSYPWAVGDSSAGLGFSTGGGTNDHFVGVGVTRPSPFYAADGTNDIGSASYVSVGTLRQAGLASHPDDSGGPYYPTALGETGYWTNILRGARIDGNPSSPTYGQFDGICAGLLVGRIITTTGGASEVDVKAYLPQAPIYTNIINGVTNYTLEADINNVVWERTYSFTETNVMNHLLVWMHGNVVDYDAIRVGTTYGDVVGLELVGAPQCSPNVTNYAGTTVTISENAALNTGAAPMSFQWLSNSVPLGGATNSTLVLANTTTNFTADYSVIVSNIYGTLTSLPTHLTINPAIPPFFVANGRPVSITRYVGSPSATFTTHVDGTPPFTYQWQHAGTNIFSATITDNQNNTLVLPPIAVADAGTYSVLVTNQFGSTNSAVPGPAAILTEIVLPTNTYPAAVLAISNLFGYWRLDDNATVTNPAIIDYWGNHNGVAVDVANSGNMVFQTAGAPFMGFPQP
ncbi:MAG TPA: immunoglobulin domain-containing protein, partial [Verrucomicrobiae bacterium]